MTDKSIIIVIPYFGQWPDWIDLLMISCRWNPTVNWLFFTDCGVPSCAPDNVRFIEMSFGDYRWGSASRTPPRISCAIINPPTVLFTRM